MKSNKTDKKFLILLWKWMTHIKLTKMSYNQNRIKFGLSESSCHFLLLSCCLILFDMTKISFLIGSFLSLETNLYFWLDESHSQTQRGFVTLAILVSKKIKKTYILLLIFEARLNSFYKENLTYLYFKVLISFTKFSSSQYVLFFFEYECFCVSTLYK